MCFTSSQETWFSVNNYDPVGIHVSDNCITVIESSLHIEIFTDLKRKSEDMISGFNYDLASKNNVLACICYLLLCTVLDLTEGNESKLRQLKKSFFGSVCLKRRMMSLKDIHDRYIESADFLIKQIESNWETQVPTNFVVARIRHENAKARFDKLVDDLESERAGRLNLSGLLSSLSLMLHFFQREKYYTVFLTASALLFVAMIVLHKLDVVE